jgi:membrane-associated protease RseP (regulator of RpoE activity)
VALFFATFASTSYVGALNAGVDPLAGGSLAAGFAYSVPLMAILLTHELGHYVAGRIHRVPVSPPYFVPMPLPPLGTMGAVILMPERIRSRNALLDVGAAGPLAGMAVALPVLLYGIATSPVEPLPDKGMYFMEGRSLLYVGLLYALKAPIPEGHDIMLNATAFAGWAGLLVTMINLIPALQLDGGHVAYAILHDRYERMSRLVRRALLPLAVGVGLAYGLPAYLGGKRGDALSGEMAPGFQWFTWWLVLGLMARMAGREHPPTDPDALSPRRRVLGWLTLGLFVLLFMPAWLRIVTAG